MKSPSALAIYLPILLALFAACAGPASPTPTPTATATDTIAGVGWEALQARQPVSFGTPLPPAEHTAIDGTYAKVDLSWPEWWACLRCADYRPGGGIWKVRFDQGVMRIFYDVTGWRSIASYTVEGDRLFIFNDPYCPNEVGEYRWSLEDRWGLDDRALVLEVVTDACSIDLRGANLSRQEWFNCGPPNLMTGASGHYHREPGCEDFDEAALAAEAPAPPADLTINVYANYSKDYANPPDLYADANPGYEPAGAQVSFSDVSIPSGLNRVLWGFNDWVEIQVEADVAAIGVQILGKKTMGWARILFDGQEIWRGDTLELGRDLDFYGGYIEVSGFEPGTHILRVENLGVDYRPVTVAFFGLSLDEGAAP